MPEWGDTPWRIDVVAADGPPPARVDVAIVGAGFTGLSTAWHLARRGARTAVLEAGSIGNGASGRTGGIALEGTASGLRPGADDCLGTLARVTAEAGIVCAANLPGCWELEHRRGGPGALWADGDQALYVADTVPGGTIDPGALVAGLARAARGAGATLHTGTPVVAIDAGPPLRLRLRDAEVVADHVVLAVNAWTGELGDLPLRPIPALTMALATAPLDDASLAAAGLASRLPFYTTDLPYLWGRVLDDGRLIMGAGLAFPPDGAIASVSAHDADVATALSRLEARVRGFHPAFTNLAVTHRWGGPIAFLRGREPLLGRHPAMPRLYVAGCYAGHGVALSVHAGSLLAAAITDGADLPTWGSLDPPPT